MSAALSCVVYVPPREGLLSLTARGSIIEPIVRQAGVLFSHGSKNFRSLQLDCVKCVPIPVIKQDDPPPWVADK